MSIHAKSLNQLAFELEVRGQARAEHNQPHKRVESVSAPSNFATELASLTKFIAELAPQGNEVGRLKADALTRPPLTAAPPQPAFHMDSTLGIRTRPAQRAEARKSESEVHLYPGFISRGGITGEY